MGCKRTVHRREVIRSVGLVPLSGLSDLNHTNISITTIDSANKTIHENERYTNEIVVRNESSQRKEITVQTQIRDESDGTVLEESETEPVELPGNGGREQIETQTKTLLLESGAYVAEFSIYNQGFDQHSDPKDSAQVDFEIVSKTEVTTDKQSPTSSPTRQPESLSSATTQTPTERSTSEEEAEFSRTPSPSGDSGSLDERETTNQHSEKAARAPFGLPSVVWEVAQLTMALAAIKTLSEGYRQYKSDGQR